MAVDRFTEEEEMQPLTHDSQRSHRPRVSQDSARSSSNTFTELERLDAYTDVPDGPPKPNSLSGTLSAKALGFDEEDTFRHGQQAVLSEHKRRQKLLWSLSGLCLGGWLLALVLFLSRHNYPHLPSFPRKTLTGTTHKSDRAVTHDQVLQGKWRPKSHELAWIKGANAEDGLLLEKNSEAGRDFLVVEDVRSRKSGSDSLNSITLMKAGGFEVNGAQIHSDQAEPSADLKKVLVVSEKKSNWRYSSTGKYWIFDVETQKGEALDPQQPDARVQLASWSPDSNSIVFTRDNNMFLRKISDQHVTQITHDGGTELFYGRPDWVYEEEVFQGKSATWWSEGGEFIAFLRTNETAVPEYPIQYFVSRPSGIPPDKGEENYPEVRQIKYPKAGAPNPTINLQFYDTRKGEVFTVDIDSDLNGEDRLITEVLWAGKDAKLLVKESNRESDILKVILIDVPLRTGKVVRTVNVNGIDGGWFEVSHSTHFVPSDPKNGRNHDGYVDTIIHEGFDHLAYFTPLDNPKPIVLTSGKWEVVEAPSAVDLNQNLVYFVATKESSIQRHVYSVKLDGTGLRSVSDVSKEGYYAVSFSTGAGYALLSYTGPDIPWQKVISTPGNQKKFELLVEDNQALAKLAASHDLPAEIYQTITVNGIELNVVERRPPHFDEKKQYPVLFYLYGGPGSQTVNKKFTVDFQSSVASDLGYIVVTLDGRGTGFIGREARCVVRGVIGYYEAQDQIAAAKMWAQKKYVDANRMAIWGWSYGGFMTLKTLELDGGATFKYGMAVAPVTDWRFYDSIYTERYMHTPQQNPDGYTNTSITDVAALADTTRFLIMHGVADDNVHLQNTLSLLDKLDLQGVENYDVHVFPDSDHSIYFHNANKIVYDKLTSWLVNAFNGVWEGF
ncbi:MAG: hypothetical protein LQ342_004840 [Letrouitia transgressa]|nr:MAG: hypothetical protein LQ342_004840 [Letrouitia transgressa]